MTTLDQRLHEHLVYAYANAPAVKAIFDHVGLTPDDIRTVADLARLPITSKDQFSEMQRQDPPFGGWLAMPVDALDRIFLSPGPIYDPGSSEDESLIEDAVSALQMAGFGPEDRVINAFLYHLVPAGLLFDEAVHRTGATVIPLGPGNTEIHVKVMQELRVTGYVGTPSFLSIILDKALEFGIPKAAIPLKKAFFSAEPYPPSLRAKFEGEYGIQTSQAYATADLGFIASEIHGQEGFIVAQNQVMELVDPETGEAVPEGTPGEVVVTKFDRVYPLLRFGTGDMAVMIPGSDRLRGLVGRSGEAVKVRGMFLHPNQLRFAVSMFPDVDAMQAVITRDGVRDVVTLRVVGSMDAEQLKQALSAAARLTINEVEFVESIPDGARLIEDQRTWD
ncbi:MAG: AMP-binding protein [Anaerolineales bacterium]|nr:AMP-binding protein [Anaerolineales bacterium]